MFTSEIDQRKQAQLHMAYVWFLCSVALLGARDALRMVSVITRWRCVVVYVLLHHLFTHDIMPKERNCISAIYKIETALIACPHMCLPLHACVDLFVCVLSHRALSCFGYILDICGCLAHI